MKIFLATLVYCLSGQPLSTDTCMFYPSMQLFESEQACFDGIQIGLDIARFDKGLEPFELLDVQCIELEALYIKDPKDQLTLNSYK